MATVWPEPAVLEGSAYAACRLLGPKPLGVAFGVTALAWTDAGSTGSTTLIAMQARWPGFGSAQTLAVFACAAVEAAAPAVPLVSAAATLNAVSSTAPDLMDNVIVVPFGWARSPGQDTGGARGATSLPGGLPTASHNDLVRNIPFG